MFQLLVYLLAFINFFISLMQSEYIKSYPFRRTGCFKIRETSNHLDIIVTVVSFLPVSIIAVSLVILSGSEQCCCYRTFDVMNKDVAVV